MRTIVLAVLAVVCLPFAILGALAIGLTAAIYRGLIPLDARREQWIATTINGDSTRSGFWRDRERRYRILVNPSRDEAREATCLLYTSDAADE